MKSDKSKTIRIFEEYIAETKFFEEQKGSVLALLLKNIYT